MSTKKNDKKSDNRKDVGKKNPKTVKPNPDAENVINHERDEGQENK